MVAEHRVVWVYHHLFSKSSTHTYLRSVPFLATVSNTIIQIFAGTSLVVEWLRVCLPVGGTQVASLVRELKIPPAEGVEPACLN